MGFPSVTYYREFFVYRGSDNGVYQGIRTAEMYLNRAEDISVNIWPEGMRLIAGRL